MLPATEYVCFSQMLVKWENDRGLGLRSYWAHREVDLGKRPSVACVSLLPALTPQSCSRSSDFSIILEPSQCLVIWRRTLSILSSLGLRYSGKLLQGNLGTSGEEIQGMVAV